MPELGDCFDVALSTAIAVGTSEAVIVHGLPIGTGPENGGKRYWHAWVEVKETNGPYEGWLVIDRSNGNNVCLPRELYYHVGNIIPELTCRFTYDEACEAMDVYHTLGPWVENWETYSNL